MTIERKWKGTLEILAHTGNLLALMADAEGMKWHVLNSGGAPPSTSPSISPQHLLIKYL